MQVRAAVFRQPGEGFSVETLDLAPPQAGEVQVKMRAAGVCHSDWHLVTGATAHPVPCVAGHEGAGVVEAVSEGVTRVAPGDHVSLCWAPSCGNCYYCSIDRPCLCETYQKPIWAGTMLDGSTRLSKDGQPVYHFSSLACFADRAVVPEVCCVPMPAEVPFEICALIGCAVTTGVGALRRSPNLREGAHLAVFGAGGVGLSIVMAAKQANPATLIVVDPLPSRREAALALGATHCLAPSEETAETIRRLTEGRGADTIFEAVGNPRLQESALNAVRPGGTLVLVGIAPMGSETNFPSAVLTRTEKSVIGSYYGTAVPYRDFPDYGAEYLAGTLPLDRLAGKTYHLDQINEAYADMLAGATTRGILVFEG